jgi:hypothetical protein
MDVTLENPVSILLVEDDDEHLNEARMLSDRDQPGDRSRAIELLTRAEEEASRLGLEKVAQRIDHLTLALNGPMPDLALGSCL